MNTQSRAVSDDAAKLDIGRAIMTLHPQSPSNQIQAITNEGKAASNVFTNQTEAITYAMDLDATGANKGIYVSPDQGTRC